MSRRVLYLLDCGTHDATAMGTIPALAEGTPEEVLGLFVEDKDLVDAASIPGVIEVSVHTLEVTQFSPEQATSALSQHAIRMRQLFDQSAARYNLTARFEVSRGRTIETLMDTAAGSDLVIVTRPIHGAGLRARTGAYYTALTETGNDVLFVNEPWKTGSSVVVVCPTGTDDPELVISRGKTLAQLEGLSLVTVEEGDARLPDTSESALINLCEQHDARVLVIPATPGVDWNSLLAGLLDKLSCSLFRLKSVKP